MTFDGSEHIFILAESVDGWVTLIVAIVFECEQTLATLVPIYGIYNFFRWESFNLGAAQSISSNANTVFKNCVKNNVNLIIKIIFAKFHLINLSHKT